MKHKNLYILLMLLIGLVSMAWGQNMGLNIPYANAIAGPHTQVNNTMGVTTDYTVEGWIYPTTLIDIVNDHTDIATYGRTVFSTASTINNFPIWLTVYGQQIRLRTWTTASTDLVYNAGLAINTWYHIAVTSTKGGTTKLFINGIEVHSYTNAGTGTVVWPASFTVGAIRPSRSPGTNLSFAGIIDEVRVWNVIRTPAQILDNKNKVLSPQAGLRGYWRYENDLLDSSGNGFNAAFGGSPSPSLVLTAGLSFAPTTQAAAIVVGGVTNNSMNVSWTDGSGEKRVVIMNTANSFTAPVNGTDPAANTAWQNSGQQVVFNGAGAKGSVTVTNLAPNTAYWFRVYEYNGTGVNTVYQTAPGIDNPFESPATLPVELSSFTSTFTAENYVTLHWTTQSETNVQGFYIYRSNTTSLANAVIVSPLIEATNSSSTSMYSFTDSDLFEDGSYYYWLQSVDFDGSSAFHGPLNVLVSFGDGGGTPEIPVKTALHNVYPNPFNPTAYVNYSLSKAANVRITVFNVRGQVVRTLLNDSRAAGNYRLEWNGKDDRGNSLGTGIYYVRMDTGKESFVRKALMIK